MIPRPRWYIVLASLAVVALGVIASLALPLSAEKPAPQVRYVAQDNDFEQRVLERLDRLSDRLDRLEARIGERSEGAGGESEMDALRQALKALQEVLESAPGTDSRVADAYRKALGIYRGGLRIPDTDIDLKIVGPGTAVSLDDEQLGQLKEILQKLADEHGRVEFELEDGKWKVDMKGDLDRETRKCIDEIVDKIQEGNGPTSIKCTVDKDGTCMLSIATARGEGISLPELQYRVEGKAPERQEDALKLFLQPKKMPDELRDKLKALDEEYGEKTKKLLKEYGFDENDFPMLRFRLGDGLGLSLPQVYEFGEQSTPRIFRFEDGNVWRGTGTFGLDEEWLKDLQKQLERVQEQIRKQIEERGETNGDGA
jgi:hypothetical protein